MQKQYPERLGQLFIYEAPTVFWALWNMIWPFLTAATAEKVKLVSGEEGLQAIHSVVPPSILPAALGGTSTFKPFAEAIGWMAGAGQGKSTPTAKQVCAQRAAAHARHSSIADSAHSDTTDL